MAKSNLCCRIFVIVGVNLWYAFRGSRPFSKWPVELQKQKPKNIFSNYKKTKPSKAKDTSKVTQTNYIQTVLLR